MKSKLTSLIVCVAALTGCQNFDQKLRDKTGLDTVGWLTLGLSAKVKGEQLKTEYDTLKAVEVTAQK
jgi:hypothetical protein